MSNAFGSRACVGCAVVVLDSRPLELRAVFGIDHHRCAVLMVCDATTTTVVSQLTGVSVMCVVQHQVREITSNVSAVTLGSRIGRSTIIHGSNTRDGHRDVIFSEKTETTISLNWPKDTE